MRWITAIFPSQNRLNMTSSQPQFPARGVLWERLTEIEILHQPFSRFCDPRKGNRRWSCQLLHRFGNFFRFCLNFKAYTSFSSIVLAANSHIHMHFHIVPFSIFLLHPCVFKQLAGVWRFVGLTHWKTEAYINKISWPAIS